MPRKPSRETDRTRFMAKVASREGNLCWDWKAAFGTHGYGMFWLDGREMNASRAAYLLFVGDIPEGMAVCHRCDNRECTNPNHLFLGTQGDNIRDCQAKGRGKGMFSKRNHSRPTAKLTADKVSAAKSMYASGLTQTAIASQLGVHSSVISRVVRGKAWSHV